MEHTWVWYHNEISREKAKPFATGEATDWPRVAWLRMQKIKVAYENECKRMALTGDYHAITR